MRKYKCCDCGKEFDEPGSYEECMGEFWGSPAYQTFYVCPVCGSDDYEENEEEEEEDNI